MKLPFGLKWPKAPKELAADTPVEGKPAAPQGQVGWAVGTTLFQLGDFPRYNPDALMVKKGRDIYNKMMSDDQIKACVQFKRDAVTSRKWFFDKKTSPDGGFDKTHENMELFFKELIDQMEMPFKDTLDAVLTGMRTGFSVNEKVYKPITYEGKTYWGIKKTVLLPFHTFDGGIVAKQGTSDVIEFRQMVGGRPVTKIPRDKVIYFVHQPDVDPLYGESDLKAAYRAYWSKDIAIKFQNIHLERHAGGFVTATVKDATILTDPKVKADLKMTLENISALTAILAPVGVDINLVAPARTDAYDKAIAGYNVSIAKSLLVPNLLGLSEQGDVGSYSQSQTQFEVFFWIVDKIVGRLEDAINRQFFGPLSELNFGTGDYPKFKFEPLTDTQKREIAKTWGNLVSQAAVTHTEVDENHTRKLLGYPDMPEGTIIPSAQPKPTDQGSGSNIDLPPSKDEPIKKKEPASGFEGEAREVHVHNHFHNNGHECRDDARDLLPEERRRAVRMGVVHPHQDARPRKHSHDQSSPWLKRVNFVAIKESLDKDDGAFSQTLSDIMGRAKRYIWDNVAMVAGEKSFGSIDPAAITEIGKMPQPLLAELRTQIRINLQRVLDENYDLAKSELPEKARKFKEIRPGMDKLQAERFLSSRAMKIAGVLNQDVLDDVQRELENAIKYDKSLREAIQALETNTDLTSVLPRIDAALHAINIPARLENIVRTNTSDAMNTARMALFGEPEFQGFIQAFEYSAILDDRTTELCADLNGDVRRDWAELTPPNHYQ